MRAEEEDGDDVGTVQPSLKGVKVPLKTDDEVISRYNLVFVIFSILLHFHKTI